MKKLILFIAFISFVSFINAQTNVSGGIYSSTAWTLAGSPYIITDSVVVFPGVTLTIQPGVTVKFDNTTLIEVRGNIIALGTSADSITFTSNAASPTPGIYKGIFNYYYDSLANKYSYCNFKYATYGIGDWSSYDNLVIKHSNFYNNLNGLIGESRIGIVDTCNFFNNIEYGANEVYMTNFNYCNFYNNHTAGIWIAEGVKLNNCNFNNNGTGVTGMSTTDIINCNIYNNDTGLYKQSGGRTKIFNTHIYSNSVEGIEFSMNSLGEDSILNCQIVNNGIGLKYSILGGVLSLDIIKYNVIDSNNIGILLGVYDSCHLVCNKICNNTTYDLKYLSTANISLPGNYWCTADSASTELVIYDGYDNASYGLVSFMPIDTFGCYLTYGIYEPISAKENNIQIYPNPTIDNIIIESLQKSAIEILNIQGQLIKTLATTGNKTNIDVSAFPSGVYVVQVKSEKVYKVGKFVKE